MRRTEKNPPGWRLELSKRHWSCSQIQTEPQLLDQMDSHQSNPSSVSIMKVVLTHLVVFNHTH